MNNKYQEALDLTFEETYIIDLHLGKYPEAHEALYENKEFKEYINKTEEFSNKYNQATADALQELVDKEKPMLVQTTREITYIPKSYGTRTLKIECPNCKKAFHIVFDNE